MKKITLILATMVLATTLAGCGKAFNTYACRQAVVEEMGTTDVINTPGKSYSFIVRTKDGAVWLVETYGSNTEVTLKAQLFAPLNPTGGVVPAAPLLPVLLLNTN